MINGYRIGATGRLGFVKANIAERGVPIPLHFRCLPRMLPGVESAAVALSRVSIQPASGGASSID